MKKINLTELTNEELLKEAKKRKSLFTIQCVIFIIMSMMSIITIVDKDIKVLTFLPIAFAGITIAAWQQHQLMKKELELRNLK